MITKVKIGCFLICIAALLGACQEPLDQTERAEDEIYEARRRAVMDLLPQSSRDVRVQRPEVADGFPSQGRIWLVHFSLEEEVAVRFFEGMQNSTMRLGRVPDGFLFRSVSPQGNILGLEEWWLSSVPENASGGTAIANDDTVLRFIIAPNGDEAEIWMQVGGSL